MRGGPVVSISHIDATHTEEMTAEKYHLNNAEGLTVLYVQSGIGGLGIMCEPERESQYEIYETHTTQLKGIPGTSTNRSSSAYAVKEIMKTSSGYTVRMFVTNLKALQSPGSLRGVRHYWMGCLKDVILHHCRQCQMTKASRYISVRRSSVSMTPLIQPIKLVMKRYRP